MPRPVFNLLVQLPSADDSPLFCQQGRVGLHCIDAGLWGCSAVDNQGTVKPLANSVWSGGSNFNSLSFRNLLYYHMHILHFNETFLNFNVYRDCIAWKLIPFEPEEPAFPWHNGTY